MATNLRILLFAIATIALALFALCEIGMAYPVAWWLYSSVALTFTIALALPASIRTRLPRLLALVAIVAIIAALYFVPWTSRKPFLRDLDCIRVGMTEPEVWQIMGRYLEGTGWPASPFDNPTNGPGTLTDAGSGSQYSTSNSPSGEVVIREAIVFRHSTDGAFNSDWGIVSLSSGRVVRVEFSPD